MKQIWVTTLRIQPLRLTPLSIARISDRYGYSDKLDANALDIQTNAQCRRTGCK